MKAPAGNRNKLASILKKHAPAEIPQHPIWSEEFAGDPVALFVHSILAWEAPLAIADAAFEKLSRQLVDWNDLRVCLVDETMEIVGPRYPNAFRRLLLLRTSLTAIYKRQHEVDLRHLSAAGKREARAYLEAIPEVPSFVAHRTLLLGFGSSVMPMDARLLVKLQQAGVVDPEASESAVAAWVAKETANDRLVEAHFALHAFADSTPDRAVGTPKTAKTPSSKTSSSKTSSSKTPSSKAGAAKASSKDAAPATSSGTTAKTSVKKTAKKSSKAPVKKVAVKSTGSSKKAAAKASPRKTSATKAGSKTGTKGASKKSPASKKTAGGTRKKKS
ncbi:MAG: hypothetical protein O2927_02380 [Planctomycetota bacterium]|nr:hypothetical protein [Planctomycetota bacterium]